MGILKVPVVVIKNVKIDFDKIADIVYQYCEDDGYIDEYIDNKETPEDAAEDMYECVDIKGIIADELPIEIDPDDVVWNSDYLDDKIYNAVIGPLIERVKNDLIKE